MSRAAMPTWINRALCAEVGPALFFPEKGSGDAKRARRICRLCEVSNECLQYALDNGEVEGIYGGLTPRQRRGMRAA